MRVGNSGSIGFLPPLPPAPGGPISATLLATFQAVAALEGDNKVLIVDTDLQRTAGTWWESREAEAPHLVEVGGDQIAAVVDAAREKGFDYMFIDTPARRTRQCRRHSNRQFLPSAVPTQHSRHACPVVDRCHGSPPRPRRRFCARLLPAAWCTGPEAE